MTSFCRATYCAECDGPILASHRYFTEFSGSRRERTRGIEHVHEACQQFRQMISRVFFDGEPLQRGRALTRYRTMIATTAHRPSLAPQEFYERARIAYEYIEANFAPKAAQEAEAP